MIDMVATTLGEIGKVKMCKRILKKQTSSKGDIPFYKIGTFGGQADSFIDRDLFEEYRKNFSYPRIGNILISAAGTIGRTVRYTGEDAYYQDSNIVWIDNDESKVLDDYLYYLYQNINWVATTGATITRLYNSNIESMVISFPKDLNVQRRIVDILKPIDDKIVLNNTISEQLESMAKTIYDYWFLQFEFPNEEGKPYKSSGGKMVWNEDLQREIPEGWGVENLYQNSLSKLIKPGIEKFEGNKRYLATADVSGNLYGQGSKITYESRETRANMQPTINSIWFAKMKNSVKHLLLDKSMSVMVNDTILSTGFCGLQCDENNFEYLSSFIESDFFEKTKDSLAHGATQQAVNNTDLQSIALVVPSIDILTKYHKLTSNMFEMMSINKIENERLKSLRNFLLPLLMNGQVSVARLDS